MNQPCVPTLNSSFPKMMSSKKEEKKTPIFAVYYDVGYDMKMVIAAIKNVTEKDKTQFRNQIFSIINRFAPGATNLPSPRP